MRRVLALLCTAAAAFSQGRTGVLSGTVVDASGASVPDVAIRIVESHTGAKRSSTCDAEGRFSAPFLEPGTYSVSALHAGFAPAVLAGVQVSADRESRVTLTLVTPGVSETVNVVAAVQIVDASSSALASGVTSRQFSGLPLNGRDVIQLAALRGFAQVAPAQQRNGNTGRGLPLSVAGSRTVQNNFRLDGISVTDHTGATPGSILGVNLGAEALLEFSVVASGHDAQYGRAAGGIVNAITRSGTGEFHGTLFGLHRNDNLDARNYFDRRRPEYRRHQWGGSAGGPLPLRGLFLFGSYEGVRSERGQTTINTTLSSAARAGRLRGGSVRVDPAIAGILALYPAANGAELGDTALYTFANDVTGREDFATSRADYVPSDADRVFVRYSFDDARRAEYSDFGINRRTSVTRAQSAVFEYLRVLSPATINTVRVGMARTTGIANATQATVEAADAPQFSVIPGRTGAPLILVPGLTSFPGGTGAEDSDAHAFTSFQIYDDAAWVSRGHSLRFGASVERTRFNINSSSVPLGEFRFATVRDFLENRPDRLRAQMPDSDTVRGFRQWIPALYVQDHWRLHARVTLDLGVRHEYATSPSEVNGRMANLDNLTDTVFRTGSTMFRVRKLPPAPRAGIAWDLDGTGSTVLRAGYGVSHDLILSHFILLSGVRNAPWYRLAEVRRLDPGDFPSAAYTRLISRPSLESRFERMPAVIDQPYVQQWNAQLQRRIAQDSTVRLVYAGSRGTHLSATVEDANLFASVTLPDGRLFFPAGAPRLNPALGMIRDRRFDGQSFYNAAIAEFAGQWRDRLSLQTSWTWAHSIDDDSGTFAQTESDNAIGIPVGGNHKFNRGASNFDTRQRFVAVGSWVPAAGWRLGAIGVASTGVPFTATIAYDAARTGTARPDRRGGQRPDVAPGWTGSAVTGNPDRWFDPAAFARPRPGFLGNLGRNTLRGPGRATVDLSVAKEFSLGEQRRLELRCEGFNVLNRTNFDLPAPARMQVFTASGVPEDAGRITAAAPARELQAGLRFSF